MINDVMVHLDGSREDEVRLAHGEALATAERANLTGLYTNTLLDYALAVPMDAGAAVAQALADAEQEARAAGESTRERLENRFARLDMANEVRMLQDTAGMLPTRATREARCADLFVATRPYALNRDTEWVDLVQTVLFGSGRALLLVPPGTHPQGEIRTVLVAWQDTREAARALREALPIIERATRTVVVLVDPDTSRDPEAAVMRHLARHTTRAEAVSIAAGERSTAEVLLEQARDVSADLVVMGGYGHSRLTEWIMGGVTVDMLTFCPEPILMAH